MGVVAEEPRRVSPMPRRRAMCETAFRRELCITYIYSQKHGLQSYWHAICVGISNVGAEADQRKARIAIQIQIPPL